jgi:hypothetical protein
MKNLYHDYLAQIRSLGSKSAPCVSLYLPVRGSDHAPAELLNLLLRDTNQLLSKSGQSKIQIPRPDWQRLIKQGSLGLGIFHSAGETKVIPLSIPLQPRAVVADSFHVKPIIAASIDYVEALFLHFHQAGATLYQINPVTHAIVDSYLPSKGITEIDWPSTQEKKSRRDFLYYLKQEVCAARNDSTAILGVRASGHSQLEMETFWKLIGLPVIFPQANFRPSIPLDAIGSLRRSLAQIISERHTRLVTQITQQSFGQELCLARLGKKIFNREIIHLCISLEDMHFGEFDPRTGGTILNPGQSSLKDDDLLDDYAELALELGIQVSVVPRKYLPAGKSFIAL